MPTVKGFLSANTNNLGYFALVYPNYLSQRKNLDYISPVLK